VVLNVILFATGSNSGSSYKDYASKLDALEALAWGNFGLVLGMFAVWTFWCYVGLYRAMAKDPMAVHRATLQRPLDANEIELMFVALDQDGSGILDLNELVEAVVHRTENGRLREKASTIMPMVLDKMRQKTAFREKIDVGLFILNYKMIMTELGLVTAEFLEEEDRQTGVFRPSSNRGSSFMKGKKVIPSYVPARSALLRAIDGSMLRIEETTANAARMSNAATSVVNVSLATTKSAISTASSTASSTADAKVPVQEEIEAGDDDPRNRATDPEEGPQEPR